MSLEPDSLERIVPDKIADAGATGAETLRLHLERYEFAARCVRPGRLLDVACGVGYGTRLLGDRLGSNVDVLGVDVSDAAVAYARERYASDNVRFETRDAMQLEVDEGFDSIVSLETVEHLPDPASFVLKLASLLRPGGLLVASVPTTPSVDLNPHHLHDFTERSFRRMLEPSGLRETECLRQVQPVNVLSVLTRREARLSDMRTNLPAYYAAHPGALVRRLASTLRYGFSNRYITIAWRARE